MQIADVFALMATVVGVGAAAFAVIAVRTLNRIRAEQATRLERARQAQATILSYESLRRGGLVRLDLTVHLPHQPPIRAGVIWRVSAEGERNVQVGMRVPVKVDADDANVIYPGVTGVEYFSVNGSVADK